MKSLAIVFSFVTLVLGTHAQAAATELEVLEDDTVNAALIEGYTKVRSKDTKISVQLVTVYRGTAYSLATYILTVFDSGPAEGDYANHNSYDLRTETKAFASEPTKVALIDVGQNRYQLSFEAKTIDLDTEDGQPKYQVEKLFYNIETDAEGIVTKVTRQ